MIRILFRDVDDIGNLYLVSVDSIQYDCNAECLYWFDPDTDEYCSIIMTERTAISLLGIGLDTGIVDLRGYHARVGFGEI